MIEIHRNPTDKELRWFGLALMAFFGILGAVLRYRFELHGVSRALWLTGASLGVLYYVVPPARKPLFVAWSILTFPLGWLLSETVLLIVFLGVLTPIGLALRLFGKDPMLRRFDAARESYWEPRDEASPSSRYFKQY